MSYLIPGHLFFTVKHVYWWFKLLSSGYYCVCERSQEQDCIFQILILLLCGYLATDCCFPVTVCLRRPLMGVLPLSRPVITLCGDTDGWACCRGGRLRRTWLSATATHFALMLCWRDGEGCTGWHHISPPALLQFVTPFPRNGGHVFSAHASGFVHSLLFHARHNS